MRKYVYSVLLLLVVTSVRLSAQTGLGFYHMARELPHGTNVSPFFFPDAGFYLGLGGIQASVSSPYDIKDLYTETSPGNFELNLNTLTSDLDNRDFLSVGAEAYALNLGLRLNEKSFITIFGNVVSENSIQIPKKLINFLLEGNGAFIGSSYEIDDVRISSNTYTEVGVGYGRKFTLLDRTLMAGVRLKYLMGVAHVSIDKNSSATITTTNSGDISIDVTDGILRTAGLAADGGSFSASNSGVALDFGGEYDLTDKFSVSFTARDLGFIKWKQNSTNIYEADGNVLSFSGLDSLGDLGDITGIGDTLEDVFNSREYKEGFTKMLNPEFFWGARYKLTKKIYASATIANYLKAGRLQTGAGLGITGEFLGVLTLSGTVAKVPENGIDFGAGIGLRFEVLQLYAAADGLSSLNSGNASYFQANAGAAITVGRPTRKARKQAKEEPLKPEVKKEKGVDREAKKKEVKEKMEKLDQDKEKFEKKLEEETN